MTRRTFCLVFALTLFTTIAVSAHDTWLAPRTFNAALKAKAYLDLTSGMAFPSLGTSIRPDRIDVARVRLNGKPDDLTSHSSLRHSLAFLTQFNEPGIATCWVELKPRQLELTPKLVEEYFAEIDATKEVRDEWNNMKGQKRWREIYVKHAKTFIAVGDNGKDNSWSEPVGMALEIVPLNNPTTLKAGQPFSLRVLKDGQPYPNFRVGIVFVGNSKGEFRTTDSEGRADFQLPRPGKYLLRGTNLRRSTKPDLEWESDFTTLVIQAR